MYKPSFIRFFLINQELRSLLVSVEHAGALIYLPMGHFDKMPSGYSSALQLPHLDIATGDSTMTCDAYLVVERGAPIAPREIRQRPGRTRICIDQLFNPDSVVLFPGGLRGPDCVIRGEVSTASSSRASRALMRRFARAFTKDCVKIRTYLVGPGAVEILNRGGRLTSGVQCPRELDLREG